MQIKTILNRLHKLKSFPNDLNIIPSLNGDNYEAFMILYKTLIP
jgi:hypothetical protein